MAQPSLFDPFGITRFHPIEELFLRQAQIRPLGHIDLDVMEDEAQYVVLADLPGIRREDIHVTVQANHVSIRADCRSEQSSGDILCKERHQGKLFRDFTLAHDVEENSARAEYADGLLRLTLPKKQRFVHRMSIS